MSRRDGEMGFGLDQGQFNFFMRPDQTIQLLAVEDIGKFVAPIFADPDRFAGHADLAALRAINAAMQTVGDWLAGTGKDAFQRALGTAGTWDYDRG